MGTEIERKYLVTGDGWKASNPRGCVYRQGYLASGGGKGATVRVRVEGMRASYITIKGPTNGITRDEFEYDVSLGDAEAMLNRLCSSVIEKTRYHLVIGGMTWMVDVFHGANAPLVVAEVELEYEGQVVDPPAWVGQEVSTDPRYSNEHLAQFPFGSWH
jgi:CYTH domain-containing protein